MDWAPLDPWDRAGLIETSLTCLVLFDREKKIKPQLSALAEIDNL